MFRTLQQDNSLTELPLTSQETGTERAEGSLQVLFAFIKGDKLCLTRKTQFWVENIKVHLNQSRGKDKHFCSWEMTSSCISIFSYRIGLQYLSNVIAENFQLILSWLSPSCTFIVSCLNEKTHIKRLEMTIKGSHNSTLWMFFKTIPHHYTFFECL